MSISQANLEVVRTNSEDLRFLELVNSLDEMLAEFNGEAHKFYSKQNLLIQTTPAVVVLGGDVPLASGAFREKSPEMVEIKRMFVRPEARGQGVSRIVLKALEQWAAELGHSIAVLETSKRLAPANGLYESHGYHIIPNYPPYEDQPDTVCYQKSLLHLRQP